MLATHILCSGYYWCMYPLLLKYPLQYTRKLDNKIDFSVSILQAKSSFWYQCFGTKIDFFFFLLLQKHTHTQKLQLIDSTCWTKAFNLHYLFGNTVDREQNLKLKSGYYLILFFTFKCEEFCWHYGS